MKIKLMFVLPLIVISLLGCEIIQRVGEPRYYALTISGDDIVTVWNLNRYGTTFYSGVISESTTAVMAETGDLLYIFTEDFVFLYRYDPKDGQDLSFTSDPDAPYKIFLNGQLMSLYFYDEPGVWEWIEDCDVRSLRDLRSLYFLGDGRWSQDLTLIKKIADARPNTGLFLIETAEDSVEIISLFTPTWLSIEGPLDLDEEVISRLKKLKCLITFSPEDTQFVEELPHLETLIVFSEFDAEDIQFNRLPKLRSLTLIECTDISSLETFGNMDRLRNLYLIECEIEDVSPICSFPKLTGLGLSYCDGAIDLSVLQNLARLRWFSFPPDVSQNDFSTFLSQHPGLKVSI